MDKFLRPSRTIIKKSFEAKRAIGPSPKFDYGFDLWRHLANLHTRGFESSEVAEVSPSGERDATHIIADLKTFAKQALACGQECYRGPSLEWQEIVGAHKVYLKGLKASFIVAGRLPLRGQDRRSLPSDEHFPSIDQAMGYNLGLIDDELTKKVGSIISGTKDHWRWTLLKNDSWFLGGVHGRVEFHFASPLKWENLWNEKAGRITLMARELIAMKASGYEIWKPHLKLEPIASVDEKNKEMVKKAMDASLPTYNQEIKKYGSPEGLESLYQSLPKEVRA